ncbi:CBS domain-containing protein [Aliiroseovarius crassostreae]|uniref:CBS domain-containing protein n=1 Tax=Aliiroseovarius crassostreae TaxID=154981 RepID=UPI003C797462
MPTSYRSPIRGDHKTQRSHSQDQSSNLKKDQAQVHHIMDRKGRDVITISPSDTIGHAVEVLRDEKIGALVVTDDQGALSGILSERDIVRKLADTPGHTLPQLVSEVMTAEVETCGLSDSLDFVLKRMTEGRFRHLPVLKAEQLIGMVSIGDVIQHKLLELEHEALQLKQLIVG